MKAQALGLPGCYLIEAPRPADARGDFFKLFHEPAFRELGLETRYTESFLSTSHKGVIRGMHFQLPPSDGAKLMTCITGKVRDGLTDLRRGSPTYGQSISLLLSGGEPAMLYIPRGIAHGFAALEDDSRMWYLVAAVHNPAADTGVLWSSTGIDWWAGTDPVPQPLVSSRDQAFLPLAEFDSPFVFEAGR